MPRRGVINGVLYRNRFRIGGEFSCGEAFYVRFGDGSVVYCAWIITPYTKVDMEFFRKSDNNLIIMLKQ